jgi:hypothetical protein
MLKTSLAAIHIRPNSRLRLIANAVMNLLAKVLMSMDAAGAPVGFAAPLTVYVSGGKRILAADGINQESEG